ncbi:dienelactone hydrolase family protein [Spongiactinospora sp. TRM90649]|uniref:alpha/beta hydrolase n=1 Tax=Spongiactinospora sp. TRM90649 TaxID=3031114 RepID=UPI0023F61747|nr:dienelactone hydrolase family protein [Spongiactinospora sp. TRM90649]MDF5752562.1 dienelactone hydrolase family protein [Spongiactinospora sp. TRM90649]
MRRTETILMAVVLLCGTAAGCGTAGREESSSAPATTIASVGPPAVDQPLRDCASGPAVALRKEVIKGPERDLEIGLAGDTGARGVVIANTINGSNCDWSPMAADLVAEGYRVAVFQYGFIPIQLGVAGSLERGKREMLAVGARLREEGVTKLVYAGGSLGGSVAISAAADPDSEAAGVISLSGGLDELTDVVGKLRVPVLYLVAEDDFAAAQVADRLHKSTSEGKGTLVRFPGAAHAGDMFRDKRYATDLLGEIRRMLEAV